MDMTTRLCLVGIVATSLAGCGAQEAVRSTMTDEEGTRLREALVRLDAVLREKAGFISSRLAEPASDQEIDALRQGLDGAQVDCLEVWYRWHNGCDRLTDILPLGRMLSIEESLNDRAMNRKTPFVDAKRRTAIMILEDGCGDGFFLDLSSTSPRVFYHMLEDPFSRDFGRLEDFVRFITDVHASGLALRDDHGMVQFDLDKYGELESRYRGRLESGQQ